MENKRYQPDESKRSRWRYVWPTLAGVFAAASIILAWQVIKLNNERNIEVGRGGSYRTRLVSLYDKSFDELIDNLNDTSNSLAKIRVSSSPSNQAILLGDVWRSTDNAQSLLAQLPVQGGIGSNILNFVTQMGDYCFMLAKKVSANQPLTEQDYEQLAALEEQCRQVTDALRQEKQEGIAWDIDNPDLYNAELDGSVKLMGADISESLENYPKLIYDGPFSETAAKQEPKQDLGAEVTLEQAMETAKKFFDADFEHTEDREGELACYGFEGTLKDGQKIAVYITKKGGKMYSAMPVSTRDEENKTPDNERVAELEELAAKYLEERGFHEMTGTYSQFYNGLAILNMAPVQEGIILYPDLVKVWMDIQSGEVVGIEAHNYLVFHTQRDLPVPAISMAEAQKKVTRITVENSRLVLIPTDDLKEKLCYEFTGVNGKHTFVIDIDAMTGEEVEIMQIINADEGTFVY